MRRVNRRPSTKSHAHSTAVAMGGPIDCWPFNGSDLFKDVLRVEAHEVLAVVAATATGGPGAGLTTAAALTAAAAQKRG